MSFEELICTNLGQRSTYTGLGEFANMDETTFKSLDPVSVDTEKV